MKKIKLEIDSVYIDRRGCRVKIIYLDMESKYLPRYVGLYIDDNGYDANPRVQMYREDGYTDITNIRWYDLIEYDDSWYVKREKELKERIKSDKFELNEIKNILKAQKK